MISPTSAWRLAKECGASHTINVGKADGVEELQKADRRQGRALCARNVGQSGCPGRRCTRDAALGHRVCFVGEGGTITLQVSTDMIRRQVTLMGSWTFSTNIQDECTKFVADRGVDIDRQITESFKLSDAATAYEQFDKQTMGKGMIIPD